MRRRACGCRTININQFVRPGNQGQLFQCCIYNWFQSSAGSQLFEQVNIWARNWQSSGNNCCNAAKAVAWLARCFDQSSCCTQVQLIIVATLQLCSICVQHLCISLGSSMRPHMRRIRNVQLRRVAHESMQHISYAIGAWPIYIAVAVRGVK